MTSASAVRHMVCSRRSMPSRRSERAVIPVVEEQVSVTKGTREVERVRLHKHATLRTVEVDASSTQEEIEIVHVPINRPIARPPDVRVEGSTTIVPVVEEVVAIERRLVLKEEIHVTKRRVARPKRLRVPVRVEKVDIQRELPRAELGRRGER